jgi:hypothetical protein
MSDFANITHRKCETRHVHIKNTAVLNQYRRSNTTINQPLAESSIGQQLDDQFFLHHVIQYNWLFQDERSPSLGSARWNKDINIRTCYCTMLHGSVPLDMFNHQL